MKKYTTNIIKIIYVSSCDNLIFFNIDIQNDHNINSFGNIISYGNM